MRIAFACTFVGCLLMAGCDNQGVEQVADDFGSVLSESATPPAGNSGTPQAVPEPEDVAMPEETARPNARDVEAGARGRGDADMDAGASRPVVVEHPTGFTPVRIDAGVATLTPQNTTIQFVGKHTRGGENDPMARTGVFEKFTGTIEVDPATKMLTSATAEIETASLIAFDPRLTNHLKGEEFIDVETYPTIKFASTRIEPTREDGKTSITGNLTLHGVTKEITLPASVIANDAGVTVRAELSINRREFGINHPKTDGMVLPNVKLTLAVGKKTERPRGGR